MAVEEALRRNLDKEPNTAAALKKVVYKAYLKDISAQNASSLQVSSDDLVAQYKELPLLRISQLVLKGTPEKNAAKIRQIRMEHRKGIPFRKLVLKYSEDQTALQAGDLDYRSIHNFPEHLYRVVRLLPKNALSEPIVESGSTFFFVWNAERSFNDAPQTYKSFLTQRLSEQRELALLRETLGDLRKSATVEILAGNSAGGTR